MPRDASHLNPNPWTDDEDDYLWEIYRPGISSEYLAARMKLQGFNRSPTACRLRACRLRAATVSRLTITQPSEVEILALHRPWR